MSKIIICSGVRAETPYHIEDTGVNIYSIEELSYYIYTNIYSITEETFSMKLADFMEEQLHLPERASKLRNIFRVRGSLKDVIVCILCSCDYLTEHEIKYLIGVIDRISELTPIQRKKILADQCLESKNYAKAKKMYQEILEQREMQLLEEKEQGAILHNLGIAVLYLSGAKKASELFELAYEHNHSMESLRQYLLALKCGGKEEVYQSELEKLTNGNAMNRLICEELASIDHKLSETNDYQVIQAIGKLRKDGRMALYQREVGQLLAKWKHDYRQQNVLQEG